MVDTLSLEVAEKCTTNICHWDGAGDVYYGCADQCPIPFTFRSSQYQECCIALANQLRVQTTVVINISVVSSLFNILVRLS